MKTKKEGTGRLRSPGLRPGTVAALERKALREAGAEYKTMTRLDGSRCRIWTWEGRPKGVYWFSASRQKAAWMIRQSDYAPRRIKTRSVGGAKRSRPSPKATQKRKSP